MKITRENATSEQIELYKLMSEISERCWCAGWCIGIEVELWDAVFVRHNMGVGISWVTNVEVDRLSELSKKLGGWWYWPNNSKEPLFVSSVEWEKIYHSDIWDKVKDDA